MNAVGKYCKREMRRLKPTRRNKKPEENVVESLMKWYRSNGFFMRRYEAKAKFIQGEWRQVGVAPGTPDLLGVCPLGYFHACEVKAPGGRSKTSDDQLDFLYDVIDNNGFACVADSVEYMRGVYNGFIGLEDPKSRRMLLANAMPKSRPAYDAYGRSNP